MREGASIVRLCVRERERERGASSLPSFLMSLHARLPGRRRLSRFSSSICGGGTCPSSSKPPMGRAHRESGAGENCANVEKVGYEAELNESQKVLMKGWAGERELVRASKGLDGRKMRVPAVQRFVDQAREGLVPAVGRTERAKIDIGRRRRLPRFRRPRGKLTGRRRGRRRATTRTTATTRSLHNARERTGTRETHVDTKTLCCFSSSFPFSSFSSNVFRQS
jgi:hypothetical protein